MSERRIINIADLPMGNVGNGGRFAARAGRAGSEIGSVGIGCSLVEVPPGKSACPSHRHHVVHEMFFVLDGEGETRLDQQRFPIRRGDLIAAPAGKEAHQIFNTGTQTLRYLAFSAESATDIIEYPDSGKLLVEAGMGGDGPGTIERLGRLIQTDYYDGENQ